MVSCQKCRQPISPQSFPNYSPSPLHPTPALDDSLASLSPSTYDLLSHSDRYHAPPPNVRPYYNVATRGPPPPPHSARSLPVQRLSVSNPHALGPAESFVVLSDSILPSAARSASSTAASLPSPHHHHHLSSPSPHSVVSGPPAPSTSSSSQSPPPPLSSNDASTTMPPSSLNARLTQLQTLSALLSSHSSIDHPLCTECADHWVLLMQLELEEGKKERDRLVAFEKDVVKRRHDAKAQGTELTKDGLEKDITKLKKAEAHAVAELKQAEATKDALEEEKRQLEREEAQLALEEAEFWTEHSKYVLERDTLQDRANALAVRLANGQKELDKLARTNVYNDAFCIGQESGLGTINSLRLGRLATVPVEWPEINAALGHTLLLLETIATKFGYEFEGWRIVPSGSFSRIERKGKGDKGKGKDGESYELYGSSDLSISRVLQNRRFDFAMVAFLDCLRQLIDYVCERDRSVRVPHRIVKDKIGDVSIKYQFGTDETWSRALRHVLLDLKILLGRASI
ncbi:hypothetical protein JCM10212_000726 [Sporobolomyces blumeae]